MNQIRIAGRKTQGVILFRISKEERVVSVVPVTEDMDELEGAPDQDI